MAKRHTVPAGPGALRDVFSACFRLSAHVGAGDTGPAVLSHQGCTAQPGTVSYTHLYIKTRMLLSIHDEEALSELEQLSATLQAHQRQEDYFRRRK